MTNTKQISHRKPLNFNELSELWIRWKSLHVRPSTLSIYQCHIKAHLLPLLQEIPLDEFSSEYLEQLCAFGLYHKRNDNIELSAKTRIDIIRTLNNILRFGFDNGYLSQRVNVNPPRPPLQRLNILREEEQIKLEKTLKNNIEKNEALGIYLCLYTGIRVGELCGLRWDDIDLDSGIIQIRRTVQRVSSNTTSPKTQILIGPPKSLHSNRDIPIPNHVISLLKQSDRSGVYFLSNSDQCFEPRRMQRIFSQYLEKAGISHHGIHCTRHTFATRWVETGLDIKSLSEILGHTSIRVTMDKYVHISEKIKRKNINKILPFI